MSFVDPLSVNDASGPRSFAVIRSLPDGTQRVDTATTLSNPRTLAIKHSTQGSSKASDLADRHLLQFTGTLQDNSGRPQLCVCNLTIAVPRSVVWTRPEQDHLLSLVQNFLSVTANRDKFLRGES